MVVHLEYMLIYEILQNHFAAHSRSKVAVGVCESVQWRSQLAEIWHQQTDIYIYIYLERLSPKKK